MTAAKIITFFFVTYFFKTPEFIVVLAFVANVFTVVSKVDCVSVLFNYAPHAVQNVAPSSNSFPQFLQNIILS